MRRIAAAALLAVLAAGAAEARQHFPARGHRIMPAVSPLDAFTTPAGAYSMRKLRSAYAGPAVRLRRASDNAEADIKFLGCTGFTGCPIDTAAAAAHCAATSCFGRKWYDQSGNGRDAERAAAAEQPALVFNCQAGLPCFRATLTAQILNTVSVTNTPVSPVSMSTVANRNSGTGGCMWSQQYGANSFGSWNGPANQWSTNGISGGIGAVALDAVWHAGMSIINGAGSVLRIDATETTGSNTAGTAASTWIAFSGWDATTCSIVESILWNGYALTPAERAALQQNQKSFWGTP